MDADKPNYRKKRRTIGSAPSWRLIERVRNPWGIVPLSAGGRSLTDHAQSYMRRVEEMARRTDCSSTRHHYVPQAYLRAWSPNEKQIRVLDTVAGTDKTIGIRHACTIDSFYRVRGLAGTPHNQVEAMLAVLDGELARLMAKLRGLRAEDDLSAEDFMSLGLIVSLQRLRTPQRRRLMGALGDWERQQYLQAKHPELGRGRVEFALKATPEWHVESLFDAMWDAADNLTTRQLEVWDDSHHGFVTCDSPVLVPRPTGVSPNLVDGQRIWWPISPTRAICFARDLTGEKVVFRQATRVELAEVRQAVVRGRERFIIARPDHRDLPTRRRIQKRPQLHLSCKPHPRKAGACLVAIQESYASAPDTSGLCRRHRPLLRPELHA